MLSNDPMRANEWRAIIEREPLEFDIFGDSMYPTLRKGDRAVIEALKENAKRGNILVYLDSQLVIHRYMGGNICRGDNCIHPDPPIHTDQIVGIVRHFIRDNKKYTLTRFLSAEARLNRMILWRKRICRFFLIR